MQRKKMQRKLYKSCQDNEHRKKIIENKKQTIENRVIAKWLQYFDFSHASKSVNIRMRSKSCSFTRTRVYRRFHGYCCLLSHVVKYAQRVDEFYGLLSRRFLSRRVRIWFWLVSIGFGKLFCSCFLIRL